MINKIIEQINEKARESPKRIVFPEGSDDRILKAVVQVRDEGIAKPIVLGNIDKIKWRVGELHLDFKEIEIIDPENSEKFDYYVSELMEIRKSKGMTKEEASELVIKNNYYGTMMVQLGDADGLVSGAIHSTADTIRPALQIIKIANDAGLVLQPGNSAKPMSICACCGRALHA